jgi:hypothetical protein
MQGSAMKFNVPRIDRRSDLGDAHSAVINQDTGESVGYIISRHGSRYSMTPPWSISLLGDKYTGEFDRWDECRAFAEGVEAVLRHMMSDTPSKRTASAA